MKRRNVLSAAVALVVFAHPGISEAGLTVVQQAPSVANPAAEAASALTRTPDVAKATVDLPPAVTAPGNGSSTTLPAPPPPAPMPSAAGMPAPAPAPPTTITTESVPAATAAVSSNALPPMSFYASVAPDELFANVKASAAFAQVDKELLGSPIQLRITHTLQPTAGGQAAGLLSAIWAGSTLGLLPVVTNNNLVLAYEIRVNGKEIARYDFQRSFTRAIGIWGAQNDPTHGLGAEGLEWAKSTATEFAAKAAQDPALLALAKEYRFYFGSAATNP